MGGHDLAVHLLDGSSRQHPVESAGSWRDLIALAGAFVSGNTPAAPFTTSTRLASELLTLAYDDQRLYSDFTAMLGSGAPTAKPQAGEPTVAIQVLRNTNLEGYGYLHVTREGRGMQALDYFIGYGRPDCPYREVGQFASWRAFSDDGDSERPLFLIRGEHCFFRLTDNWTIVALSLVFRAAFGFQEDAILFHAAAVVVRGKGFMLAGPRYAGKSTLSLALAARGHSFLSDEIAWYVPSTRQLIAFRRPVGVRNGIRAAAIDARIKDLAGDGIEWHDSLRLPVDALVPQEAAQTATLDVVVFLKGFEEKPRIVALQPSLDLLPMLQPTPVSMLNASPARRMLEMVRLVSSVRMYDLYPGHPDETARILEEIAR